MKPRIHASGGKFRVAGGNRRDEGAGDKNKGPDRHKIEVSFHLTN